MKADGKICSMLMGLGSRKPSVDMSLSYLVGHLEA